MRTFAGHGDDLSGKSVLVTGGTGSFGRRFVRRVLETCEPDRIIVFSRDEFKQYEMAQEIDPEDHKSLRYFIGDVRDKDRLEMAMRNVDVVVHAAALKHVPTAEYNPLECVYTNIHGAENVVKAAMRSGVEKVVALSTDKAANPINLYGATKLASDKIFIAANNLSGMSGPRFSVVRYGNVVNSRGSVIPFFQRLIADGATRLPVTDLRMTRFWITLTQGVDFVLASLGRMVGGEVFVPKIPSMRIVDLVEALVPGAEVDVVGVRPGEKLHELMVPREEARLTLEFPDFYVIEPAFRFWSRESYLERFGGEPVADDFQFDSQTNPEWLSTSQLLEMLRGTS